MNLTTNLIAARMGLQFSWIEANSLGFFLADARNLRGKFDEIKEKFAINPAPIALQSSLIVGGSRWTRDLPRNFLNSFTNRSKIQEQERNISVFKEKFSSISWAIEAVVGADLKRRGGGFTWWRRSFRIGLDQAMILLQFFFEMAMIFTTIVPRSGHDRDPGHSSIAVRSIGDDSTTYAPRSRLDRTAIVEFFHETSESSDEASRE